MNYEELGVQTLRDRVTRLDARSAPTTAIQLVSPGLGLEHNMNAVEHRLDQPVAVCKWRLVVARDHSLAHHELSLLSFISRGIDSELGVGCRLTHSVTAALIAASISGWNGARSFS